MNTYQFTLLLDGPNIVVPDILDSLFEAGCDDALFGTRHGQAFADFVRGAPSLSEAITSAIEAIESSVPSLRVVRVEPETLVSAADIASRTGRSRESIRLLIEGKRGPGNFPHPVSWLKLKRPLWSWPDVARWFSQHDQDTGPAHADSDVIGVINAGLALRRNMAHLPHSEAHDLATWARDQLERAISA